MKRVIKVRWATDMERECGHSWEPREGETIRGQDEVTGEVIEYPARGPHHCVKDRDHIHDSTDDDHQCCCGNSDWETGKNG